MRAWRVLEYGEELHARLCGRRGPVALWQHGAIGSGPRP